MIQLLMLLRAEEVVRFIPFKPMSKVKRTLLGLEFLVRPETSQTSTRMKVNNSCDSRNVTPNEVFSLVFPKPERLKLMSIEITFLNSDNI